MMSQPTPEQHASAVDDAWRIHQQIADWTGKTDAKANFILGLQTALFGAAVYLRTDNRILSMPGTRTSMWGIVVAFVFLAAGMALTLWTVVPSLSVKNVNDNWSENYIYFGHLAKWRGQESELLGKMESSDILPVLVRQLVETSAIAWNKHRRLQWSVVLAAIGAIGLGVAILFA